MTRLRVAVLGAGIGSEHVEGYRANPDRFEVTVVCDLDARRAAPLVERTGADHVSSIAEAIARPDVDVVDVCLPPRLHKSAILDALAAGRHVIAEKPLVASLADVDEIEVASQAADRLVIPIFQYRFGAGIGRLGHLVDAGLAGRPLVATLETHWNRPASYYDVAWRGRWETELGGAVVGHAIHIHDLVVRVLGPIARVQAMLDTRVNAIEVEDCAALGFTMANGALVTSSVTLGSARDQSRLRFCFADLTAESGLDPYNPGTAPWTFRARDRAGQAAIDEALTGYVDHVEGFARQFELAADAIVGDADPPVALADARASIELITAIYAAARTGHTIDLPLDADAPGYGGWLPDSGRPTRRSPDHDRGHTGGLLDPPDS